MLKFTIMIASGALLALSDNVVAQQAPRDQAGQTTEQKQNPGQPTRAAPPVQTEQDKKILNQGGRQGLLSVQEALARQLHKMSEGEIELASLAQGKVDEQEFREYTERVITDHEALNERLTQFVASASADAHSNRPNSDELDRNAVDRASTVGEAQGRQNQTQERLPTANNQLAVQSGKTRSGLEPASAQVSGSVDLKSTVVPQELVSVMDKACENKLQMSMQMLEEQEGPAFKIVYLGQQIVSHMSMLAQVNAIQSEGSPELQKLAQHVAPIIESHLLMAKKLTKKIADDSDARSAILSDDAANRTKIDRR